MGLLFKSPEEKLKTKIAKLSKLREDRDALVEERNRHKSSLLRSHPLGRELIALERDYNFELKRQAYRINHLSDYEIEEFKANEDKRQRLIAEIFHMDRDLLKYDRQIAALDRRIVGLEENITELEAKVHFRKAS